MKPMQAILSVAISVLFAAFNSATTAPITRNYQGLITFNYEGTVISTGGPGFEVPSFAIGDPFRVTYTFESGTPDSLSDPTVGHYSGAVRSLSFKVGSYEGYADPGANIQVGNDYTGQGRNVDYYNIGIYGSQAGLLHGPVVSGWNLDQFILQLVDPTHTAFASDALPLTALNPAVFIDPNLTYMSISFRGPAGQHSAVVARFRTPSINLTCPPARTIGGCSTSRIAPLTYSETDVTITQAQLQAEGGTASASCGIASIKYRDSKSGNCPTLVVSRTFTVTDVCGNSTSCQQIIKLGGGGVIGVTPLTDLAALNVTYVAEPLPPGLAGPGQLNRWKIFPRALITNLGPAEVQAILVRFDLNLVESELPKILVDPDAYVVINRLKPGESIFVQPPWAPTARPGNHILRVTVDANGRIPEPNESNNVFELHIFLPDR